MKNTKTLVVLGVALGLSLIWARAATQTRQENDLLCSHDAIVCENEAEFHKDRVVRPRAVYAGISGVASFYDYCLADGWCSMGHYTCAVRVPAWRGRMVLVTDLSTGNSVECKVTDYGPDARVHPERVVDLSSTAFAALKPLKYGLIQTVSVELSEGSLQ